MKVMLTELTEKVEGGFSIHMYSTIGLLLVAVRVCIVILDQE